MPNRIPKFCREAGCPNMEINGSGYCDAHQYIYEQKQARIAAKKAEAWKRADLRRGSASERGYGARWAKYARWFLRQPGNEFCRLHLDHKCAIVAQCVDHIDPPKGRNDPKFWDKTNHQPACIHCNSVKSNRYIVGKYVFGKEGYHGTSTQTDRDEPGTPDKGRDRG